MGTPYTNNQNNNTLQIAEMLGSRHDSVKRSIDSLMNKGIIALTPNVEASILDTLGRNQTTTVC